MNPQHETIVNTFGNRLRVRVCGLCFRDEKLLMIRHNSLGKKGYLLAPPGGGLHFAESAETCLIREFKEETGLDIEVKQFLFVHEFLEPPLHAVELFFEVEVTGGKLIKGTDPEMNEEDQIIDQVLYMSLEDIEKERGEQLHNVLNLSKQPKDLLNLRGYFIFQSKS